MGSTARALARVTAFARGMRPDLPPVDETLAAVRRLLTECGAQYVLIGGLAVVHHGYVRTTRDLHLLLRREDLATVLRHASVHGFAASGERGLRHQRTGVAVDFVLSGEPIPPRGRGTFPSPADVDRSAAEPDVAALPALVELKLAAGRHQDLADVVGLVASLEEGEYLRVEAAVDSRWRSRLAELRRDALEERSGGANRT